MRSSFLHIHWILNNHWINHKYSKDSCPTVGFFIPLRLVVLSAAKFRPLLALTGVVRMKLDGGRSFANTPAANRWIVVLLLLRDGWFDYYKYLLALCGGWTMSVSLCLSLPPSVAVSLWFEWLSGHQFVSHSAAVFMMNMDRWEREGGREMPKDCAKSKQMI